MNNHSEYGSSRQTPKIIVIHAMGEYIKDSPTEHAIDFLDKLGLSAHSLIDQHGTNFRIREDGEGAYHARGNNKDSLGLEVLVPGEHDYGSFIKAIKDPYVSDLQYAAILSQCLDWVVNYGITRIARHSDLSPGRKVDPGAGFPWDRLLKDLSRIQT